MDSLYIVDSKNTILITKHFSNKFAAVNDAVDYFLRNDLIKESNKGPFIVIGSFSLLYKKYDNDIFILSVTDNRREQLYSGQIRIFDNIFNAVKNNFEFTSENIIKNQVNILIMLDFYLINGLPTIDDAVILGSLINQYEFTDSLTENLTGKPKDFNTKSVLSFLENSQLNDDLRFYSHDIYLTTKVLLDLYDYVIDASFSPSFIQNELFLFTQLEINNQTNTKTEVGIKLNIPVGISSVEKSPEVKTEKDSFLKTFYLEVAPKYGLNKIMKIFPQGNTKILLPFQIFPKYSRNSNDTTTISVDLSFLNDFKGKSIFIEEFELQIVFAGKYSNSSTTSSIGNVDFTYKEYSTFISWEMSKLEITGEIRNQALRGDIKLEESDKTTYSINKAVIIINSKIKNFSATNSSISKMDIIKARGSLPYKGGMCTTVIKNLEIII